MINGTKMNPPSPIRKAGAMMSDAEDADMHNDACKEAICAVATKLFGAPDDIDPDKALPIIAKATAEAAAAGKLREDLVIDPDEDPSVLTGQLGVLLDDPQFKSFLAEEGGEDPAGEPDPTSEEGEATSTGKQLEPDGLSMEDLASKVAKRNLKGGK